MRFSRRDVLAASAGFAVTPSGAFARSPVSVRLDPARRLRVIPADFVGLSYETAAVAVPGLLAANNHPYVRLVRNLGRQSVIRIGGNTSDFSFYQSHGASRSLSKGTVVNDANFRQLRDFLDAIGWNLIWGLNLGSRRVDNAVAEARAIGNIMGDRLLAFQIGNEPDQFENAGHRVGRYDYNAWHSEYRQYKAAIRAIMPRARFAGPDIAGGEVDWMQSFAREEGSDLRLLTAHHYIAGQSNPGSTIALMLKEEKKYQAVLAKFQAIAEAARLPLRICETGSFWGGGKLDVSDTFAAALWALDYLFMLASYGCAGANFETGINHLGWISHYTPIDEDPTGGYVAAAEYYGLLAFSRASRGEQISTVCDAGGINLTAYAVRQSDGKIILTVINKDLSQDAAVEITGTAPMAAHALRLLAPSLSAKSGIKLGGATVGRGGTWKEKQTDFVEVVEGKAMLGVPAGSAALVTLSI